MRTPYSSGQTGGAVSAEAGAPAPLDTTEESTFDRWVAAPEWDTRTLAEFAASGGSRVAPPVTLPSPPWP